MIRAIIFVIAAAILVMSASGIYHQWTIYQAKEQALKQEIAEKQREVEIAQQEYDLAFEKIKMYGN